MDGKRELPLRQPPRRRQAAARDADAFHSLLVRTDERVVPTHLHALVPQPLGDLGGISLADFDREEVVCRPAACGRERPQAAAGKRLVVSPGDLTPPLKIAIETEQQGAAKNRRMELVKATVETQLTMFVAPLLPIVTQRPRLFRDLWIGGKQSATVAEGAEVLGGIEAGRRRKSHLPRRHPVSLRARGLRAVLDQNDVVIGRQLPPRPRIERVAVEVYGQNRPDRRLLFQSQPSLSEVQPARVVDVAPDGLGTGANDRQRGCKGRQGRRQDAISGPDACTPQPDL